MVQNEILGVMFKNKNDEENIEEALDLKVISAINQPYSKAGKPSQCQDSIKGRHRWTLCQNLFVNSSNLHFVCSKMKV